MKNIITLLSTITFAIVMPTAVQAIPIYYTFEGKVTQIVADSAGAISNAGFTVGSTVTYTLIVDFDAAASETHFGGYVDYDSYLDTPTWDYFYVDYFSGDALQQINGGSNNTVGPADGSGLMNASESNWGYNTLISQPGSALHVNSDDDLLQIKFTGQNMTDWVIGTVVHAGNWAYDDTGQWSQLFASVELVEKTPVNMSVPEPGTLALLGIGLVGMGLTRRRRKI